MQVSPVISSRGKGGREGESPPLTQKKVESRGSGFLTPSPRGTSSSPSFSPSFSPSSPEGGVSFQAELHQLEQKCRGFFFFTSMLHFSFSFPDPFSYSFFVL